MTTVDHQQPSLHLVKKSKDPVYRTPHGRVVIALVAACPKLRPFMGVMLQYLIQLDKSVKAEGLQALSRYKAYKATFLEVVASNVLPSRKFKHAMPLLRIAVENREDTFLLSCLHSVFRFYDLYAPSKSMTAKALDEFIASFTTSDPEAMDHSTNVSLQDEVFDFRKEIETLVSTPEFKKFTSLNPFPRVYNPEERAILLTKKGTAKFSGRPPIKGYAPAIVGSTAELHASINTCLSDGTSYYEVLTDLGNAIGRFSFPSMKVKELEPPMGYLKAELRRNVALPANGLKTRIIAVGDYNTQYMLSPIHRWAFQSLRQIKADYTFSHDQGFQALTQFTEKSSYVACFDLSNATDAFPVSFSREVLRMVAPGGDDVAAKWLHIMTCLPFEGHFYRRGQPMGLLSSWAVFALSHHFVIWLAAAKAGGNLLSKILTNPHLFYGIVGDDVFITHPALAHYYQLIMSALGVKINLTKSLLVTSDKRVSEFVKRNSFNGREISAISPGLITKSFDDYACFRELVLKLRGLASASRLVPASYDEATLCETAKVIGGSFLRRAIGTLCTVPEIYSGLLPWEQRAVWPPLARFKFLALKAQEILDLRVHGTFISSNGRDVYNDLVQWLLQDITVEGTFHRTQFYEYMQKQGLLVEGLLGPTNSKANILIGQLSLMASSFKDGDVSEEVFSHFEEDFLRTLQSFAPEQTLSVKAVNRATTRSYAFKIYKSIKDFPTKSEEVLNAFQLSINAMAEKYTFKLPSSYYKNYSPFGEIER